MKSAIIYPKFKKGCTEIVGSYRPISILPNLSKYVERAIYNQLLEHLNATRAIGSSQHGFSKGKSTNTALFQLCESINIFWEKKV